MTKRALFLAAALLLAACSGNGMTGEVVAQSPSPDGSVTATLTRDDDVYRVYLSTKSQEPWEMLRTTLHDAPTLAWKTGSLVMLQHACGSRIEYPHGTGNGFPHAGAASGVQAGFSNIGC